MTDLVLLEPAQRELEEIAKIHMNLADQIPQKNSTNLILGTLSRLEPFPLSGAQRFNAWRSTARVRFPFFSVPRKKDILLGMSFFVERAKGIEPSTQAWEARILPLNYARICGRWSRPTILYYLLFKTSTTLAGILRHFSSEMDASETRRPMASGTRKIPSASSSRLAEAGSSQGIDAKNPPS